MNKAVRQIRLWLMIIIICSCGSPDYIERYNDGSVKLSCEKLSGNRIKCHSYYENGMLKTISTVDEQGKLQGEKSIYDKIGLLQEVANYKDDKKEGTLKSYNGDVLLGEFFYRNGIREGEYIQYNSNGTVALRGTFRQGLEVGFKFLYDSLGKLLNKRELIIKNGKSRLNQWWSYRSDGSLDLKRSNFIELSDRDGELNIHLKAPYLNGDMEVVINEDTFPMINGKIVLDKEKLATKSGMVIESKWTDTLRKQRVIYFNLD